MFPCIVQYADNLVPNSRAKRYATLYYSVEVRTIPFLGFRIFKGAHLDADRCWFDSNEIHSRPVSSMKNISLQV
jgi:hypothetical protein